MPKISPNTIQNVKDRVDILEVVSKFIDVKRNAACCPFHEEKTPSFHIHPAKNICKCFGCGRGGDSIWFVMEHEKKSYPEAIEYLAAQYNVGVEYDENYDPAKDQEQKDHLQQLREVVEFAHKKYVAQLATPNSQPPTEYLQNRGLTNEQIAYWGLGYAPNDMRFITPSLVNLGKLSDAVEVGISVTKEGKNYDFYRNRIIIPIHDKNGQLVGLAGRDLPATRNPEHVTAKYVNPLDSPLYHKEQQWFGLYQAITARAFTRQPATQNPQPFAYIVEGYFDVITFHEAGCLNTIAPCGTAITDGQIRLLKKYTDHVVLVLDGDSAGQKAAEKHINSFIKHGFKTEVIELPEGTDPDDYVKQFKKEHIASLRTDAIHWKAQKLYQHATTPDQQEVAIDQMVQMMLCIPSEVKRNAYIEQVQKACKIKNSILKKEVRKAQEKQEAEQKRRAEKAMIDGKNLTNEAAGLPEDFNGDLSPVLKYGIYQYKGVYWAKGKQQDYQISNFTMKILFHIESTGREQAYKIITVTNEYGINIVIQINTDDYITLGGFKKALARKGNFVFRGTEPDLSRLQEYLQETQVDSRMIEVLGYNKAGFYAWANGITVMEEEETILNDK